MRLSSNVEGAEESSWSKWEAVVWLEKSISREISRKAPQILLEFIESFLNHKLPYAPITSWIFTNYLVTDYSQLLNLTPRNLTYTNIDGQKRKFFKVP